MEKPTLNSLHSSSQRSRSLMTIDTAIAQNAYTSQLQRTPYTHTPTQQPRRQSMYSSKPVMSPDELSAKIADNFQQFSSMLNQLQKPTPQSPASSRPTTPIPNRLSRPSSIDNKRMKRFSLKDNDLNNKGMTLLSPVSMVSPLPPLINGTTTTPKKATQDKPLVTEFLRAASNGDTSMVKDLVHQCRDLVYDADTDDGTTALMYAACFGHVSTVQSLLDADASIDEQDHYGWTALMWATVNHHDNVVNLLLSQGATSDTPSIHGTTAFDLILPGQQHHSSVIASVLKPNTYSRRHSLTVDRMEKRRKSKQLLKASRRQSTPVIASTTTNARTSSSFLHSGNMDAYTHFMTTESERHRRLTQRHELFYDALLTLKKDNHSWMNMDDMNMDDDDDDTGVAMDDARQVLENHAAATDRPFAWDSCLVDQMFVFSMNDLDTILDMALDTKSVSIKMINNNNNKDDVLWLPANLLFLCARFAYYYSDRGALTQFFDIVINRLSKVSKQCAKDASLLQYWMTNVHQLLVYLRRDTGLETTTAQQQRQLADVMTELYLLLIRDYERHMDKMITDSVLDHEPIGNMAPVDFEDANDWSTFFQRRGSIRASMDSLSGGSMLVVDGVSNASVGPHAITTALDNIQTEMTTVYELPGYMVTHAITQCLYYVLCEAFNQILASKVYLCRSKAQHIRFNLSALEEWARQTKLVVDNIDCVTGLDRLAQLLQFLQCVSELDDVDTFRDTCRGLTLLNAVQIKRCVVKYRYEIQEAHLPVDVEEWVAQCAQRQQQQQKQSDLNRNTHMQQLKDFLLSNHAHEQQCLADGTCTDLLSVDSRWILPFYQHVDFGTATYSPTHNTWNQQDSLSESMYLKIKQKAERDKKEPIRIPSLPYKFIDRLDKKLHK
ncbi:unnamed protein product [Absidia cylindrospora]